MTVEDCLAHKWLADESPERPLALEGSVENVNVNVAVTEAEECQSASELVSPSDSMEELAVSLEPNPISNTPQHQQQLLLSQESSEVEIAVHNNNSNSHQQQQQEEEQEQVDQDEEELVSIQSYSDDTDDQSEESASNSSDKENSYHNNISMNSSSSSHSSTEVLFPDAPTTPKVLRKAPSATPPSVKALVKKFQVDSVKQQMSNAAAVENGNNISVATITSSPVTHLSSSPIHPQQQQSACFVSQIPKLVHSPKALSLSFNSSINSNNSRYSKSPSRVSTGVGRGSIGQRLSLRSGLSMDSSFEMTSLRKNGKNETVSSSTVVTPLGSISPLRSNEGGVEKTASPKKSPSRYTPVVMACVICGEFVCRHQTTNATSTVVGGGGGARKAILGMEQRITC